MKKTFFALMLCFGTFAFVSCGGDDDDDASGGGGKSGDSSSNLLLSRAQYNLEGQRISYWEMKYDEHNNLIAKDVFMNERLLTEFKSFVYKDKICEHDSYTYNDMGGLIEQRKYTDTYSLDVTHPQKQILQYKTEEVSGHQAGPISLIDFQYDSQNRLIGIKQGSRMSAAHPYEIIQELTNYVYGDKKYTYSIYTYGGGGVTLIGEERCVVTGLDNNYEDFKVLQETRTNVATGAVVEECINEYDSQKRLSRSRQYYKGELDMEKIDYKYSADGLTVSYEIVGSGKVEEVYKKP